MATIEGSESLRFDDVVTFLTVHHTRSISAAARQLDVTPSQVSKAVARLEAFVGARLLTRGPRGVTVSMAGLRTIPMLEEISRGVRDLRTQPDAPALVRLAAPSSILSTVAGVLARSCRDLRFSCLELDPVRTRALAFEDVFDAALVADDRPLGDVYTHEPLGVAESCLLARPSLARKLGDPPIRPDRLQGIPFVMPVLLQDTGATKGRDLCPFPFEQRTPGHAAATFHAALELAAACAAPVGRVGAARVRRPRRGAPVPRAPRAGRDPRRGLVGAVDGLPRVPHDAHAGEDRAQREGGARAVARRVERAALSAPEARRAHLAKFRRERTCARPRRARAQRSRGQGRRSGCARRRRPAHKRTARLTSSL